MGRIILMKIMILIVIVAWNPARAEGQSCEAVCGERYDDQSLKNACMSGCTVGVGIGVWNDAKTLSVITGGDQAASAKRKKVQTIANPCWSASKQGEMILQECTDIIGRGLRAVLNAGGAERPVLLGVVDGTSPCDALKRMGIDECPDPISGWSPPKALPEIPDNPCLTGECPGPIGMGRGVFIYTAPKMGGAVISK